jgi:hypothetical protein
MKLLIPVMFLALSSFVNAQETILTQDAITKPSLSIRCKELHQERSEKIKVQQKLNALLQRNRIIIKKTPTTKEIVLAKLKSNQIRIKNELHLMTLQIQTMEENIIRSGCPGLAL